MKTFHRVSLAERQLANIDARCELMVYGDLGTAEQVFEALCAETEGEAVEAEFGEAACGFKSVGVRDVHFRRGLDVATWAAAVDGRLTGSEGVSGLEPTVGPEGP